MKKSISLLLLIESIESQRAIEKLADLIIEDLTKKFLKNLKDKFTLNYIRSNHALPGHWPFYVGSTSLKNFAKKPKVKFLRNFLTDFGNLLISAAVKTGTTRGSYQREERSGKIIARNIFINFDPKRIDKIVEKIYETDRLPTAEIISFWSFRKDDIIHELTHAYDSYISLDKGLKTKEHVKAKGLYSAEKTAYFSSTHEINARYSETVQKIEKAKVLPTRQFKRKGGFKGAWLNYLKEFKNFFVAWDALDEKQQRRLEQRLLKEYNVLTRDQQKELKAGALVGIMWHFALQDTKPDYTQANTYDERITIKNPKAELKKLLKKLIDKPESLYDLRFYYEGVYNALIELFSKETQRIPLLQKEMRFTDEQISKLGEIVNAEEF